jgi:hypothetical protein
LSLDDVYEHGHYASSSIVVRICITSLIFAIGKIQCS